MKEFIRIQSNPPPPRAEVIALQTADCASLRAAAFGAPPDRPARGCVVLLTGRSEFIEKYFETVRDLQARGFNVVSMDWRGQGLSERLLPVREKGHIPSFRAFAEDLRLLVETVARPRFAGPYYLLSHSMGGAPSLQLLADGYDAFSGAVLCAPLTEFETPLLKRLVVTGMTLAACRLGLSRASLLGVKEHSMDFEGNVLTSDPARHQRFRELQEAAPNAVVREPTYGWVKAAIDAISDLHRKDRFAALRTPVLLVSAEKDELVRSRDHARLAMRSPLIDRTVIEGALHEILMERDVFRNAFWSAFDRFIAGLESARCAEVRSADPQAAE